MACAVNTHMHLYIIKAIVITADMHPLLYVCFPNDTASLQHMFFMLTYNSVHFVYKLLSRVCKMFPIFFTVDHHNDPLFLRVLPYVPIIHVKT